MNLTKNFGSLLQLPTVHCTVYTVQFTVVYIHFLFQFIVYFHSFIPFSIIRINNIVTQKFVLNK